MRYDLSSFPLYLPSFPSYFYYSPRGILPFTHFLTLTCLLLRFLSLISSAATRVSDRLNRPHCENVDKVIPSLSPWFSRQVTACLWERESAWLVRFPLPILVWSSGTRVTPKNASEPILCIEIKISLNRYGVKPLSDLSSFEGNSKMWIRLFRRFEVMIMISSLFLCLPIVINSFLISFWNRGGSSYWIHTSFFLLNVATMFRGNILIEIPFIRFILSTLVSTSLCDTSLLACIIFLLIQLLLLCTTYNNHSMIIVIIVFGGETSYLTLCYSSFRSSFSPFHSSPSFILHLLSIFDSWIGKNSLSLILLTITSLISKFIIPPTKRSSVLPSESCFP